LPGPLLALAGGFFGHGYFSLFGAQLAELFPTAVRGTAQGLCYNAGRALSAAAPATIGASPTRPPGAPGAAAFFVAGAVLAASRNPRARSRAGGRSRPVSGADVARAERALWCASRPAGSLCAQALARALEARQKAKSFHEGGKVIHGAGGSRSESMRDGEAIPSAFSGAVRPSGLAEVWFRRCGSCQWARASRRGRLRGGGDLGLWRARRASRAGGVVCGLSCAVLGFSPGFPYLIGLPRELEVERLPSPRPRVPAGSVAIAGPFAGVYPSATPGGWRLLGRLGEREAPLFDPRRDPPARFAPGDRVRFVPCAAGA
jgi:hypothetical protein